jgi:uncharacterized protein DUF4145
LSEDELSGNGPPEHVTLICPHCDKPSSYAVHGHVRVAGGSPGDKWDLPTMVMLASCEHCYGLVVVGREYFSGHGYDDPYVLWPERERPLNPAIPAGLREDHGEARTCFKAKAYRAAVVMVRRLLEGVCRENQIEDRNLHRALGELKARGVIDDKLLEWAHSLRAMGNIGAHYGVTVSRQDAEDAIQLSEAILDYIYVLTAKFNEFKARKARIADRAPPPPPTSVASA